MCIRDSLMAPSYFHMVAAGAFRPVMQNLRTKTFSRNHHHRSVGRWHLEQRLGHLASSTDVSIRFGPFYVTDCLWCVFLSHLHHSEYVRGELPHRFNALQHYWGSRNNHETDIWNDTKTINQAWQKSGRWDMTVRRLLWDLSPSSSTR